jgi:hypothetical protein
LRETQRAAFTDAVGAAGDNRDPAFQSVHPWRVSQYPLLPFTLQRAVIKASEFLQDLHDDESCKVFMFD